MAKKLGVFIIHGMGRFKPDFADGFIQRIKKRLSPAEQQDVEFEACCWSPVLEKREQETWRRLRKNDGMRCDAGRHWLVSYLGDPATYLSGYMKSDGKETAYAAVHEAVRKSLASLATKLAPAESKPVIVLAHSLGAAIMSNYIWDETHSQGVGKTPFEKLETLTSFVTYGANIPLFLPLTPPLECIAFPPAHLPDKLKSVAAWKNIFAPHDVLGYPLSELWDEKHGTTIDDIAVHAGVWPLSRTPLSHIMYTIDGKFLGIVSSRLKIILSQA